MALRNRYMCLGGWSPASFPGGDRLRFQASTRGISSPQIGAGEGFCASTSAFPVRLLLPVLRIHLFICPRRYIILFQAPIAVAGAVESLCRVCAVLWL